MSCKHDGGTCPTAQITFHSPYQNAHDKEIFSGPFLTAIIIKLYHIPHLRYTGNINI